MLSSSGSYGSIDGLGLNAPCSGGHGADDSYHSLIASQADAVALHSDVESEPGFEDSTDNYDSRGRKTTAADDSPPTTQARLTTIASRALIGIFIILVVSVVMSTNFDALSSLRHTFMLLKSPSSTSSSSSTTSTAGTNNINKLSSPTDTVIPITTTTTTTTIVTSDTVTDPTNAQIAAGESVVFKFNRVGYSPITLADEVFYYTFLQTADTDVIIEPFAAMQLVIMDWSDTSVYYKFIVCKSADSMKANCQTGSISLDGSVANVDVKVMCEPYDEYVLEIYGYSTISGLQSVSYGSAMCMYVRREIRQLSTEDLDDCMDAMYTMYSVSTEKGEELYGDEYKPSSYLLGFHHFNSAWQEADHIHEGNGFLPQHIKMTNIVETSLQAINPSIALPYWDFTVDQSEGKSSVNSAIMTPTLFGSMNQPADLSWGFTYSSDAILDAAIPDGRWAYLAADKNSAYSDLVAAYGYMRAPWNMNPSPYISRFTMDLQVGVSLPSCQQHYDTLVYTDLMSYLYDIQYEPHATTHSLTGGIYGCDLLQPLLDAGYATDETSLKTVCSNWLFYVKEFYRYNYITPNSNCTVTDDVQSSTCGFTCTTDETELTSMLFNLKNKLADYVPSTMSDDGWKAWQDFVCTGDGGKIFSGDHLESASPADPSFWVIHPTLERLYHAKLMAGGFDDNSWATDAVNDFVCDKAECYMSTYGAKDYYTECCYGHYENDQFLDFATGNKSHKMGDTNGAVLIMTDPRSEGYSMPYIYDGFTWKHCSQDFDTTVRDLATAARRRSLR